MQCENFSTLTQLLRVTAYVLRAVKMLKGHVAHPRELLSPVELTEAEWLWIVDVLVQLKYERNFSMWQKQLNLFPNDKGLIRCRGRLENANLPYSTKYQLFLPR